MVVFFFTILVAELGDRSQISAIGLATKYSLFALIVGGAIGHCFANFLAVTAGTFIGKKCGEKCINYTGGILFLFFAVFSLIFDVILGDKNT